MTTTRRRYDKWQSATSALGPTTCGKTQLSDLEAAIGLLGICRHVAAGGAPPDYLDPLDEICARYGQRFHSYVAAQPFMLTIVEQEKTRARDAANRWKTLGSWWPT